MSEKAVNYYHDKIGMGFYHLDPRWCSFADFEHFVSLGITNAYIMSCGTGTTRSAAKILRETGSQIWLGVGKYNGKVQKVTDYIRSVKSGVDAMIGDGTYDQVVGFHWDEPILGMTNEDFLEMTKAMSEEFGKRIYPVFSGYETMGKKGNFNDPDGVTKLESFATKYITDYGFDSYGYDFRKPYNTALTNRLKAFSKDYVFTERKEYDTTDDYYRLAFRMLRETIENKDARAWVYPTAYNVYTWGGYHSDEDYCIAHLEGLKNILLEQENPGGIHAYTFKTWRTSEPAMDYYLGKYCPERWTRYEEKCREVFKEISEIKTNV